jgi:hypothetical protein
LGFVSTLQQGLAASAAALLAQLSAPAGASAALPDGAAAPARLLLEDGSDAPLAAAQPLHGPSLAAALDGGGAAVKQRLDATRRATAAALGELEDAAAAEARVKQLLGRARARVRELADQAAPTARGLGAGVGLAVGDGVAAAGRGGVGLDDLASAASRLAGRESRALLALQVQQQVTERVEAAAPGTRARAQGLAFSGGGVTSADVASTLGLQAELRQVSAGLEDARAALALAAQPALKAAVTAAKGLSNGRAATAAPAAGEAAAEDSAATGNGNGSSGGDGGKGGDDDDDAAAALALAEVAAAAAKQQLSQGKAAVEAQLSTLAAQVQQQVQSLSTLAASDPKLAKIVAELEGQSEALEGLQAQVHASRAAVEALKGRDALGSRVAQLLAGDDVDQLAAAGKRLYGKLSDRDSVGAWVLSWVRGSNLRVGSNVVFGLLPAAARRWRGKRAICWCAASPPSFKPSSSA